MANVKGLKLCVISNILNHGYTYDEWSTSFVIGLSQIEEVESITVYCPPSNGGEEINLPEKCRIIAIVDYNKLFRIISLSKRIWGENFDQIIIITGPTAFGNGILSNFFGTLLPLSITRRGTNKVKIINQGSTLTHDVTSLGYKGILNSIKLHAMKVLEKYIYKRVRTYFQLKYYCERVANDFGKQYVAGLLPSDFIDAWATLYLNGMDKECQIIRKRNQNQIGVLLHGFWGPQKDPKTAMEAVKKLKIKYPGIRLTVSGGINNHFPGYREYFQAILDKYEDVIDNYLALPASLGATLLAKPLLEVLVGGIYASHYMVLQIMVFSYSFFSFRPILSTILLGNRKTKIYLYSGIAAFGANLFLSLTMIPLLGIYGAVIAILSAWVISTIPRMAAVGSLLNHSFSLIPYIRMWINAIIMVVAVFFSEEFFTFGDRSLIFPAFIGIVSYFTMSIVNKPFSGAARDVVSSIVGSSHPFIKRVLTFLTTTNEN